MLRGWSWAVAAGSSAAGAAVCAKYASPDLALVLQILCYGGVVGFNLIMWTCYMRSLEKLSSLEATVTNFGANFLVTGFAGLFLFGETLHAQWFVGACFIVLGVLILSKPAEKKD